MVTRAQVLAAQQAANSRQSASPPSGGAAPVATTTPPQRTGPTRAQVLAAGNGGRQPTPMTPSQQRAYEHERSTTVDPGLGMLVQGANLGWADEADAETEGLLTKGANAIRKVTGQEIPYTSQEIHDAALRVNREGQARALREHPTTSRVLEFTGGMLTPWGRASKALEALGIASPFLRALTLGGVAGGTQAAGDAEGDAGQRAAAVPGGVLAGTATAGALHGGGRLLSSAPLRRMGGAITEAASRIAENFGRDPAAPLTPRQAAQGARVGAETVADLVRRAGATPETLHASAREARGAPVTSAEELGREAQTALKIAGRRSGRTPDALETMLSERATETPHRIVEDFGQITGINPAEADGDFAAMNQRLRAAAAPLYEQAYAFQGPVVSDELTALLKTPAVRAAMRNAVEIAGNERINPESIGLHVNRDGSVEVRTPTLRTWDMIKRGLDEELEGFRDSTTRRLNLTPRGRSVLDVLSQVRNALTDTRQPWGENYAKALNAGGDPIRLETVFRDAANLMSNNVRMGPFEQRLAAMTDAERQALRAGIVSDARARAGSGRVRLNNLLTRDYEQKLIRVFGADQGQQLIQRLQDERFLLTHGRRMQPGIGSDTSETLLGNQDQEESIRMAGHAIHHAIHGRPVSALLTFVADPLMGLYRGAQMPIDRASRDAMGELLMMRPSELANALEAHLRARGVPNPTHAAVQALIRRMIAAANTSASARAGGSTAHSQLQRDSVRQAISGGP